MWRSLCHIFAMWIGRRHVPARRQTCNMVSRCRFAGWLRWSLGTISSMHSNWPTYLCKRFYMAYILIMHAHTYMCKCLTDHLLSTCRGAHHLVISHWVLNFGVASRQRTTCNMCATCLTLVRRGCVSWLGWVQRVSLSAWKMSFCHMLCGSHWELCVSLNMGPAA